MLTLTPGHFTITNEFNMHIFTLSEETKAEIVLKPVIVIYALLIFYRVTNIKFFVQVEELNTSP